MIAERKTSLSPKQLIDPPAGAKAIELSDFLENILESSTEYSIIGKDLQGQILLWNAGARRLYGYDEEEVVGKANSLSSIPRPGKSSSSSTDRLRSRANSAKAASSPRSCQVAAAKP